MVVPVAPSYPTVATQLPYSGYPTTQLPYSGYPTVDTQLPYVTYPPLSLVVRPPQATIAALWRVHASSRRGIANCSDLSALSDPTPCPLASSGSSVHGVLVSPYPLVAN